ncbi:MAG TPA: deoxyribonuclease IV [Blastocatellia bacterium]|nr:deoxyribonuclease IV [Blastocatellia bacterium]
MEKQTAPIVGVHTSIAGGLPRAAAQAAAKGCDAFQIFSRNPRGWADRPLGDEEVRAFRSERERAGLWPLAVHSVYLINLAAQDPLIQERSRNAFRQEVERCLLIGADFLVVHPGNPRTVPASAGILTAAESIRRAVHGLKLNGAARDRHHAGGANGLSILIENTAGQGSSIGCSFEQVADLLALLDDLPVGVCLDTAHTFASGYDISTGAGFKATVSAINRSFGFDRIRLIHCNDSKAALGSRVDRHQHIGLGHIGERAFRRLARNLKFRRIPFILETPVDDERGDEWNMNTLRRLAAFEGPAPLPTPGR